MGRPTRGAWPLANAVPGAMLAVLLAALTTTAIRAEISRSTGLAGQELIDALANHNSAPEMVRVTVKKSRYSWSPLFPADYGWDEDARVSRPLNKLIVAECAEMWPVLAANCLDKRYALTQRLNERLRVLTVGDVCYIIAHEDLREAHFSASPRLPWNGEPVPPLRLFETPEQLAEWWAPRRGMPLYELQIEAAELALAQVPKFDPTDVPKERADKFVASVAKNIAQLRETKKALLSGHWPYIGATIGFGPKSAEEIRDSYLAQQREAAAK